MSDLDRLVYAAKDGYAGSTNLVGTTPYLSRKSTHIEGPIDHLDRVSMFLNVYSDIMRGVPPTSVVHEAFAADYPATVAPARRLAAGDSLALGASGKFADVYGRLSTLVADVE